MKSKRRLDGFEIANYIILTVIIFIIIYPFYYLIINSFNALLTHQPSYFWPELPSTMAYQLVLGDDRLTLSFITSVMRTVVGTLCTLVVMCLCSYAMSKPKLRFRPFYIVLFTVPQFFNGGTVAVYLNYRNLGLLDTFWVYIVPHLFSFFYMVVMISAFRQIPESLEESAEIDGAGPFTVLTRIVLPVALPTIATIVLFAAVSQWNSWFDTQFYTNKKSLSTVSAVLMRIVRENNLAEVSSQLTRDMENHSFNPEGVKMATMVVAILPIITIYPFLQRYFVKGIMVGSVKG